MHRKLQKSAALLIMLFVFSSVAFCQYTQTTLDMNPGSAVSGVSRLDLVNPWGVTADPGFVFIIADNGSNHASARAGNGQDQPFSRTIPLGPTGVVRNTTNEFPSPPQSGTTDYLFATDGGTIDGINQTQAAFVGVDNSSTGAVYKGLALGNNGVNLLYAANFNSGHIDVFNGAFAPVTVTGGFTDPNLPTGFSPFNIENLGGKLYVTYAVPDGTHRNGVAAAGSGIVDVFDANGNLLQRLTSGGHLNAPWGLALSPSDFGPLSNDLLVGNTGDGTINAYDPVTGSFVGTVSDLSDDPIVISGLKGLTFGNGAQKAIDNGLYFTAGIPGATPIQDGGIFGVITIPEPGTFLLTLLILTPAVCRRSRLNPRPVARAV